MKGAVFVYHDTGAGVFEPVGFEDDSSKEFEEEGFVVVGWDEVFPVDPTTGEGVVGVAFHD